MNYVTFSDLNSLGEINFIAGTSYTIKFEVKDQDGNGIDISSADCTWRLAPFGTDYAIVTKTGSVIATSIFEVVLSPADTLNLSFAKYTHQPSIIFSNGVEVVPAQGIITITQRIR